MDLRKLQPVHWVYLVAHLLLFFAGALVISTFGGTIGAAVGTSISATGVCGLVVFIYVFVNDDYGMKIKQLAAIGFSGYFSSRGSLIRGEYESRIERARGNIDVIGFGLKALRQDHLASFPAWKAKAQVRILLLDPEFPTGRSSLAAVRDAEEGHESGTIAKEVKEFVQGTQELCDDRFQIRLARCIPSVNFFRIDDEAFWGPYLVKKVSRNSPTFLVRRGGEVFDVLQDHFDEIWRSPALSREVPDSWAKK